MLCAAVQPIASLVFAVTAVWGVMETVNLVFAGILPHVLGDCSWLI